MPASNPSPRGDKEVSGTDSETIEHVGTAAFQLREIPRFELFQGSWVIGDRPIGPEEDDRVVDFEIEGEIGTFEGMVDPSRAREIGEAFIEAADRCERELRTDGGAVERPPETTVGIRSPVILSDDGYREIDVDDLEVYRGRVSEDPDEDHIAFIFETDTIIGEVSMFLDLDEAEDLLEFLEEAIVDYTDERSSS